MDVGYVVLLLLGLVHCATALLLYSRVKREESGADEAPQVSSEEPGAP